MRWSFPSNNNGDIIGINHSGVETFQGTPLKSLAREICQNSLDAMNDKGAVVVEFKPFVLESDEFPDVQSLKKAFIASQEFWKPQNSTKTHDFFLRALKMIDTGAIPCLRISDFNTTGLTGSDGEYNTPWCNLTKSSGASDKAGTSGGSFGIGKFAPFACSELRTVFYSTLDKYGKSAFQGISRITSFRRSEDGEITVGVGYYGDKNNSPVQKQRSLDPNFSRKERTGTDIFIAGFTYTDWKTDVVISILDSFLYAVFCKFLIVKVDDVIVSKDTLPKLMEEYRNSFGENADKYYEVLTSKDTSWYEENFKNHGKIRLGLIVKPDMHRKVAMIRKTGMKIMDRGNVSGIIPFAGVMLLEGDKINDYLRNLENPQHTKWEPERAGVNRVNARIFVRDLVNYIKDCLEDLKKENSSEEIDPSVGEYLPQEIDSEAVSPKREIEVISDTILAIEKNVSPVSIPAKETTRNPGNSAVDDENGDIKETNRDGGAGHTGGHGNGYGSGKGDGDGDGDGTMPKEHQKRAVNIIPSKVRCVCLNKSSGDYSITFVPTISSDNGELAIFLSAESQNYEAVIKSAIAIGQKELMITGNLISGVKFISNTPVRLKVSIDFYDFCSMEVKGYGN